MKAGVAAALLACREAAGLGLAGDVVVAAVADEEHASLGVQEALRAVRADAAVVTEPTELDVVVAHRGFLWAEIEVTGRAAHGSRPHLGVDAIVKAGPVLTALGELDAALAERTHPLLGRGSVHASVIAGGVELSSYPARCVVGLERRTLPGDTAASVAAELDALLDRCRAADPALAAEHRTLLVREPFEVPADAEIAVTVGAAAAEATGAARPVSGASYWADAAFIAAAGIPTVMFGPSGEGAHASRGVGQRRRHRGGRADARRHRAADLRVSVFVNPAVRPAAVPGAERATRRAFHAALPGYRPTPLRDLPALAAELGLGARRAQGRVRPARAAGVQGARRVVGDRAGAARAAGRADARRGERRQPRPRRRARRRAARARAAGSSCPRARRPRGARRSPARAPSWSSSTARTRTRSRGRPPRAASRARSRSPTSARPGPARWVIDGYATLFAEAAAQGALRRGRGAGRRGVARRGRRALRRPRRRAR